MSEDQKDQRAQAAVGRGWWAYFFVCMTLAAIGGVYAPTRLYFIGEYQTATVSNVELLYSPSSTYTGEQPVLRVNLENYPITFAANPFSGLKVGQQVTVLYSERLQAGAILLSGNSYLDVVSSYHPYWGLGGLAWLAILAIWKVPQRLRQFTKYMQLAAVASWRQSMRSGTHKVLAAAQLLSSITAIVVGLILVVVLAAVVTKAVLSVEQSGPILTAFVLTPLLFAVMWLPIPEWIIDLVRRARGAETTIIEILRNAVFIFAGILLIQRLLRFATEVDLKDFGSIFEVFIDLVTTLMG